MKIGCYIKGHELEGILISEQHGVGTFDVSVRVFRKPKGSNLPEWFQSREIRKYPIRTIKDCQIAKFNFFNPK